MEPKDKKRAGTRSKSKAVKAKPRHGKRLNVLMIEDSDDDAVLTARHLQTHGYDLHYRRVDTAEAMQAALDQETWEIILLDHSMPKFNGPAALKILKDYGLDVPVIVVTGTVNEHKATKIMNAGARDLVLKSNLNRLVPAIERELEAARLRWHKTQAEQLLRMQRNMLENLMANVPDSIYFKDTQHRYIHLNHAELKLLNADGPEAVIGKPADVFLPPDRAKSREEGEKKLFATGEPLIDRIEKVTKKDGATRWYSATKAPIRDDRGNIMGLVGITRDVTRTKQIEEALRESERRFKDFATAASDWFWEMDENLRFIYLSDQFQNVTGYDSAAIIGKTRLQFANAAADDENWKRHLADLAARRPFHDFIYAVENTDGGIRQIRSSGVPFFDENRNFIGYRGTATDITERIEEQRILKQAEKMESLGSLAGGIAHDFNNMLLPILALTNLTLRKLPADSEHREKLEKVIQAATRARGLVAQILDFSRQEGSEKEIIDVVAIVKEMLGLLRTTLPSTIKLTDNFSLDGGLILANAAQIGTVLLNLASNAADAMDGKPGSLDISLTRADIGENGNSRLKSIKAGAYVKIRIEDTGHGMDEATMKRIFEPFFTTKAVGKGTGLGLATAYAIIKKHSGIIDVSSKIDVGTTFDIYLPLMEKDAKP